MARAATTADAFNAVAEPRRREILDLLAAGERPVNDLVQLLGLAQPQVSKHLRVLREVGAIDLRVGGQWRYVMVADGGYEVAFHGEYHEIVPNEKLVNTEIFEGAPEAGAALVTCTFEDLGERSGDERSARGSGR